MGILYAVITALAWGAWLAPTQKIVFKSNSTRLFHITLTSLIFTFFVMIFSGGIHGITLKAFFLSFTGGLIWFVSAYMAFYAIGKIGMARAVGIWAPLNIVVAMVWGEILFGEFSNINLKSWIILVISLVIIITGILLIIFSQNSNRIIQGKKTIVLGVLATFVVGVLWGTYFIPVMISNVSMWMTSFPMVVGMFAGSLIFNLITGQSVKLQKKRDYIYTSLSGIFWAVGNYSMFLLVDVIGAERVLQLLSLVSW